VAETETARIRAAGLLRTLGSGGAGPTPTHLLSGLLVCGCCGGPVHIVGRGRYGCGWRHKRGPTVCSAEYTVQSTDIESRVLSAIQEQVLEQEVVEEIVSRSLELATTRFEEATRLSGDDRRRLHEIAGEELNLVREVARLGGSDAYHKVLEELSEEKLKIEERFAASKPKWNPESLSNAIRTAISRLDGLLLGSPSRPGRRSSRCCGERRSRFTSGKTGTTGSRASQRSA
jgi:hypothetical protein